MRIGDLSRRTGVSPRLLRYYEEQDLLHPERSGNGYRVFGEDLISRVLQIRELLDAGLSTRVIRIVLPCPGAAYFPPAEAAAIVRVESANVQRKMESLLHSRSILCAYLAHSGECKS
ncbi:MerR family transcriptional regulator [Streptomyces sp. NPDC059009]|uniref:MerR family transcriptional regulator n=1 Tax=Streptomyces sp. NPDC059009 TaxID=3346694 RepID=UPI003673A997